MIYAKLISGRKFCPGLDRTVHTGSLTFLVCRDTDDARPDDNHGADNDSLVGTDDDHLDGDGAADDDGGVAQDEDKLYLCVSSPTIKDKPVRII